MFPWIFSLLIWLTDNGSFRKIEARNIAKLEAQKAIKVAQYTEAAKQFEQVNQQMMLKDPAVLFDLGQAYFVTKKYEKATEIFQQTAKTRNKSLSSKALTQLGNIAIISRDSAKALTYFKDALVLDADNAVARIDYEIIRKNYTPKLAKNQNPPASQKQQPTPQETPQSMENDDESKQKEVMKRLKNYDLTPERAVLILESIKNSERQYVQQRSTKSNSKKTKQEDWW